MIKEWYTSDSHWFHQKIIEYCNRPFSSVEQMNTTLIKRWNEVVGKSDKVYHLGDFALSGKEQVSEIVSQLNGQIYLIKGNHDTHTNDWYRECGFKEVYDHPIIVHDYLILSHEPLPFVMNQMYCSIYGHIHTSPLYQTWTSNSCCVCVERHNYYPIELGEIKQHFIGG